MQASRKLVLPPTHRLPLVTYNFTAGRPPKKHVWLQVCDPEATPATLLAEYSVAARLRAHSSPRTLSACCPTCVYHLGSLSLGDL